MKLPSGITQVSFARSDPPVMYGISCGKDSVYVKMNFPED